METFFSSSSSPTSSSLPFVDEQPQHQQPSSLHQDSSDPLPGAGAVHTGECVSEFNGNNGYSNVNSSVSSDPSGVSGSAAETNVALVGSLSSGGESESRTGSATEEHTATGRLLSPCGVVVPPAPPSSPESLLVLPARVKSLPTTLALQSAAAAAAAALASRNSSAAPSTVVFAGAHTGSSSSSVSTCSSHNRRPSSSSSSVPSPREMASNVSSPFAGLSPTSVEAGASPASLQREQLKAVASISGASAPPATRSAPSAACSLRVHATAGSPPCAAAAAAAAPALPAMPAVSAASEVPAAEPLICTATPPVTPALREAGDQYPTACAAFPPASSAAATAAALASRAPAARLYSHAQLSIPAAAPLGAMPCHAGAGGSHTAPTAVDLRAAAEAGVLAAPAAAAAFPAGAGHTAILAAAVAAPERAGAAATPSEERAATVVLDTGAFLRLQQLGGSSALLQAEKRLLFRRRQQQHGDVVSDPSRRIRFVAPASVLMEIRDARSRTRALQQQQWAAAAADSNLPLVMAPTEADRRWARTFAAKTGDLPALSSTDLDVIALTYMLQRQTGQVQHLRDRPVEVMCVRPRGSGSSVAAAAAESRVPVHSTPTGSSESAAADRTAAVGSIATRGRAGIAGGGEGTPAGESIASTGRKAAGAAGAEKAGASEETSTVEERDVAEAESQEGKKRVGGRGEGIPERDDERGSKERDEEATEAAEAQRDAAADADPDVEPEAASYGAMERTRGETARGMCGGGVTETWDLVELNSDEEDDGEGEWISLDNIEQLKRNATACVFEETGFPSAQPQHGAASSIVSSKSKNTAKREADPAASGGEGVEEASSTTAAASEDAVAGAPCSQVEHNAKKEEERGEADFLVACKTTDYSVQNVLLHMGLNVLAIDGYAIRSLKTWALLCRACQHVTRDVSHLFCPKCGQHAVDRVPVSFDGKAYVVFDNRKKKCTRGLVHSLPKPKGGRHEKQLILAEDHLLMGGRDRLLRHQQRVWESENAEHNFFGSDPAMDPASWYSRTRTRTGRPATGFQAPHVVVGLGPGNPNSNRWVKKRAAARTGKNK